MIANQGKRPPILTAIVLSVFVCQQSPAPPPTGTSGSTTNRTINNTVVQPDPAAAARLQFEQAQAQAAAAEARRRALAEAAALRRQAMEKAQRAIEMFQQGFSPKTEQLAITPEFRFSVFNLDPKTRQSSSPSPSPTGTPSGTPPTGGRGIVLPTTPAGGLRDSDAPPTDTFTAPSYSISNPTDIPRVMDVVRTRGRWVTAFGSLAQGVTGPIQMTAFTTSVFPPSLRRLNGQQFAGRMISLDASSNPTLLRGEGKNITLASAIQELAVPVGLAQPGETFTGPAFDAVNIHLRQALSETPTEGQINSARDNFDAPPTESGALARHNAVVAALPKGNDGRPIFDRAQAAEGVFVNKIKDSVKQTNDLIKETMDVLREAKTMADEAAEKEANAPSGQAPSSPTPNTANNGQPNSGDDSETPDSGQDSPTGGEGGNEGGDGDGLQAGNVPTPGALPDGRALADLAGQPPVVPQLDPALTASLNQPQGQPLIFNPVGNPVAAQIQPIRPDGNVQALAPTSQTNPVVNPASNLLAGNFGAAGPVAPFSNGDPGPNTGAPGETGSGTSFGPGSTGGTASLDGNYGDGINPNFGARAGLDNPQKGPPYGSSGAGPGSDPSGGTIATGVDGLPGGIQNQLVASGGRGKDGKGRGGLIGQMEDGLIKQICKNTDQRKLASDFCDNITSVAARESVKSPTALDSVNRAPAGI